MATEQTPTSSINLGKICQVLAVNDRGFQNSMMGKQLDERLPIMMYNERKAVEWVNNTNPSDPTLQGMSNYLYSLLYQYLPAAQGRLAGITGGLANIIGPTNQSVLVGANAVFSVTTSSPTKTTFQWFMNGVAVPGATTASLTIFNAQLSQSGSTFFVIATNAAGMQVSGSATLTVTQSITGFLYYSASDPGPTLLSNSDPFNYQSNFQITHNSPISVPISVAAANNQFLVVKVPSGESLKTTWFNTNLNQGNIPPPADFIFATPVSFGGFTYYYTKTTVSLDPTQPLVLT